MPKHFECVPNISEGRRAHVIEAAARAAREGGAALVDVSSDAAHNRSVFTMVGDGPRVLEGALRLASVAVESIDLREHRGEHPRMGAIDVIPFVPIGDATMEDAVALARRCATQLWERLGLPAYYYGAAATRPERRKLADLRRGEFEGLLASVLEPGKEPDVGGPRLHPSAGIVAVGARPFLIAYNIDLASPDLGLAKSIAALVRESSGGFPGIQAKGFALDDRTVQVSMNVTDFRATPLHLVTECVRREAAAAGVTVLRCELVGLSPLAALADAAAYYLNLEEIDVRSVRL